MKVEKISRKKGVERGGTITHAHSNKVIVPFQSKEASLVDFLHC